MKKQILTISAVVLVTTGCGAMQGGRTAQSQGGMGMKHGQCMMMGMKKFDGNGDGMLSKAEFMTAHEAMFEKMKGPNGSIALDDMQMRCKKMMDQGGMKGMH